MGVQSHKLNSVLEVLSLVPISLAGWILIGFLTVVAFIYRHLVDIVLRLKYQNKYGGLFDTSDSLYQSVPCNISSVLFIKCQEHKDVLGHVKKLLQEKVFDNPNHYPKLTGSMGILAGYPYWLKNDVNVNDVLKTLEPPEDGRDFDENYLSEVAAAINDESMPVNGKFLWTFYVSPVPLVTKNKDGCLRYPIVGNFSHCIGDGASMVELYLKLFGDDSSQNYGENIFRKLFTKPSQKTSDLKTITQLIANFLRRSCIWLEIIFVSLGRSIKKNIVTLPDENVLKPKLFSGKKHVAWATEIEPKAIGMIKHIKNKENSKFVCVFVTAIVASLTNYFKENSLPVPKSLTVLSTLLTAVPKFRKSKPAVLDNKQSAISVNVPTTLQFAKLKPVLKLITETMTVQVRYADILLLKMMVSWIGNLPLSWMKYYDGWKNETCFISNVPGGTRVQVLDGSVLETIVPIIPIFEAVGLAFSLISYDDRLQIEVSVDQKLATKEKAQQIVDGILENISLLYEECKG